MKENQMSAKPVVKYHKDIPHRIVVGGYAFVTVVDHLEFSPNREVRTSTVLAYDQETGVFETKNTHYQPV